VAGHVKDPEPDAGLGKISGIRLAPRKYGNIIKAKVKNVKLTLQYVQ
jgi:hypothetical protein